MWNPFKRKNQMSDTIERELQQEFNERLIKALDAMRDESCFSMSYREHIRGRMYDALKTQVLRMRPIKKHSAPIVCEVCGCIVEPMAVVYGESEIRKRKVDNYGGWRVEEEYIHKPTYCKVHAPKEKKHGKTRKSVSRKA